MSEPIRHPRPRGFLLVISIALLIGMGSLVLSVQNAFEIDQESDRREQERIGSDVAACERGNALRQQLIDGFAANEEMVTGILDLIFAGASTDPERAARAATFREALNEPIGRYHDAVSQIGLVDCQNAVPGA